jgi:carboxylate-amine ligase
MEIGPGQTGGPAASQPGGAPEPEHRFGASAPLSIGVEEELLLVDDRRRLVAAAERLVRTLDPEVRERVSTEIFATQIELKTGICDDAGQALEELARLRRSINADGVNLLGSGLHPDDDGEAQLVAKPRYSIVKEDLASLLSTPPSGLHVHVGMPDPETAIRVANALRYHLPLLQALTANSPFREGADSGLASARAAVVRSYPRFEMPREFRDFEEFRTVADQLIVAAGVPDYTFLWWDVRPHPRLGTVEVRGMDVQTDVATNVAIAALIQGLAAKECEETSTPGLCREAIEESSFQANRHGLDARLMVDDETAAPAREVAQRELEQARPYADQLGGGEALDEVERILRDGNGAEDQRRVHERTGMEGLLGYLTDRTAFAARRRKRD